MADRINAVGNEGKCEWKMESQGMANRTWHRTPFDLASVFGSFPVTRMPIGPG
jgi:hypothetical protein